MIKAEKTIDKDRINLVDTEYLAGSDKHYVRQISIEEARELIRSLKEATSKI